MFAACFPSPGSVVSPAPAPPAPAPPSSSMRAAAPQPLPPGLSSYAEASSLLTLHVASLAELKLSKEGAKGLVIVVTHGLTAFTLRAPPPAAAAAVAVIDEVCRAFIRRGEENYVATATIFEHGARAVPLARAYIPLQALADGRRHAFRVALHAAHHPAGFSIRGWRGGEGELGLTDAQHNELLARLAADAALPHPTATGAAVPPGAEGEPVVEPETADTVGVLALECWLESKSSVEARFVRRALADADADGDGHIDAAELVVALSLCGMHPSPTELDEILASLSPRAEGGEDGPLKVPNLRLVDYLTSKAFADAPMAYCLLGFLADGGATMADVSRVVDAAATPTKEGAGRIVVRTGGRLLVDELGLVCQERDTGLLVAEHIPQYVKAALQLMYHSGFGKLLTNTSAVRGALRSLSEREGRHMDSPSSRKGIASFVAAHKISLLDLDRPLEDFETFNAFFARKRKAGARPIVAAGDASVVSSPADCRICVFASLVEATGVWVKGELFSIANLLGSANADVAEVMAGCSIVIARLAPQDYHRYHAPVAATVLRVTKLTGSLYTVNPIAIRQPRPDVYTSNKREVMVLQTTAFGLVVFVAVGATAVGSICTTVEVGQAVERGDELGYFQFGGSTVIALFQRDAVTYDEDLVSNSLAPLETIVKVGARVGIATGREGLVRALS